MRCLGNVPGMSSESCPAHLICGARNIRTNSGDIGDGSQSRTQDIRTDARVSGTTIIGMMNVACRRIVDLRSQRSAVNGMQSNDIEEHLPPALPPPALPPPALPVGHEGQVSAREWRRKGEAPLSKGRPLFLPCMLRDASSCLSVGRSRVWVCPRHVEPLFVPIPIETSPVPNRTSHRVHSSI